MLHNIIVCQIGTAYGIIWYLSEKISLLPPSYYLLRQNFYLWTKVNAINCASLSRYNNFFSKRKDSLEYPTSLLFKLNKKSTNQQQFSSPQKCELINKKIDTEYTSSMNNIPSNRDTLVKWVPVWYLGYVIIGAVTLLKLMPVKKFWNRGKKLSINFFYLSASNAIRTHRTHRNKKNCVSVRNFWSEFFF